MGSVFGLIGDGGAYSEGAAYGSDQAASTYSPYSVYGKVGSSDALYQKEADTEGPAQKKIAKDFFQAIEETTLQSTLKNQDKAAAAAAASIKYLDDFVATYWDGR